MQTYLNDPHLKAAFLAEIAKHEAADAIIKGTYYARGGALGFRGCAIGCALHSLNVLQGKTGEALTSETGQHARYEAELGLPTWFAHMEDDIFEALPDDLATTWPRRLAEAIPVGAVITDVELAKILRWTLADEDFGVRHATDDATIRSHIDGVIAGFDAEIASGGHATTEQREAAVRAARDAWGTRVARDAWDAWAARDARDAWDAWDAINADSGTSAASRKRVEAFYPALAEFVLDLMRALPAPAR